MAVAGEKLSDSLVRDLVRFYESAEKDILNKINAIALKGDSPGTLAHLKTMRENIQQIKKQCQEANQSWVEQAIPRMYSEGLFMADIMLEDLDFMGKAGFGGIHTEAATVLMENTYNRLEDVVNTIGRQTDDIYRALALDHIKGTVLGYDTWTESAKSLQMDLDQRGVTGFIDRMGRKWNMSSYVQMVARTTTMEAHLQGTSNRLLEQGFDLVKVSSHSGACELCLPWEGQILSISGQSEEYPSLDEAKRQGLFHPNCRHAYGLHIDLDSDLFTELGIEPEVASEEEAIPATTSNNISPLIKINPDWKQAVEESYTDYKAYRDVIDTVKGINIRNMPQSEIDVLMAECLDAVDSRLKKTVGEESVKIRAHFDNLVAILEDGRFKSQFETQSSGGFGGEFESARVAFERGFFGIEETADPRERPIYGYVAQNSADRGYSMVEMYGDLVFVLKDEVKERTTATWADSLSENRSVEYGGSPKTAPTPLNDLSYHSVPIAAYPDVYRMDPRKSTYYWEAQIFGGVDVSKDVSEVIFTQVEPTAVQKDLLKKHGISFSFQPGADI